MRILTSIAVAVIIGVVVGGAIAYVDVRSDPDAITKLVDAKSGVLPPDQAAAARVEVPESHYNFGTMERGTSKSHEFVIRSVGAAPLTLRGGSTSCKCTLSQVPTAPVPPGGSTKVKVEWSAKSGSGEFTQTAKVETSDPTHSEIELTIGGQIVVNSAVEPTDFVFDKLMIGESKSAQVFVMAMLQDELTVKDPEFSDPTLRDKFDVKIEPVEKDALPNKLAHKGVRITLSAKPDIPVGRFVSWLRVHTDLKDSEKLDIPISGQVVGDITVRGLTGWNEEQGVLVIGSVKSSEGAHGKVNLIVRGKDAADVKFDVKSVTPEGLKITIGKPQKIKDTFVQVPVDIEIPKNTPPMVHLDTAQGEAARIVFSTTHPKVKELAMGVRFAVER
jgi:hypothetical protein